MRAATFLLLSLTMPAFAADPVALHCDRLFDARSGRVLGEHTIVVEDGRIRSVIPGRAKLPDGTGAIVLGDRTCLPGWIDLHVHLGGQSSPSYSEGFRLIWWTTPRAVGHGATLQVGFTPCATRRRGQPAPACDAINQAWWKACDLRRRQPSPPPAAMPIPSTANRCCRTCSALRPRPRA